MVTVNIYYALTVCWAFCYIFYMPHLIESPPQTCEVGTIIFLISQMTELSLVNTKRFAPSWTTSMSWPAVGFQTIHCQSWSAHSPSVLVPFHPFLSQLDSDWSVYLMLPSVFLPVGSALTPHPLPPQYPPSAALVLAPRTWTQCHLVWPISQPTWPQHPPVVFLSLNSMSPQLPGIVFFSQIIEQEGLLHEVGNVVKSTSWNPHVIQWMEVVLQLPASPS